MIQQIPDCLSAIGWFFEHDVLDDDTEGDHDGASGHEQEVNSRIGHKDFVHHLAVDFAAWTNEISGCPSTTPAPNRSFNPPLLFSNGV